MTRKEIEKAIEKGESVWSVGTNYTTIKKFIKEHKFDKDIIDILEPSAFYKTKAEAEHYLHHANITRTEQLPFLTWEEFDKGNRLIRFIGKNGERCKLEGYQSDDTQGGFIDVVVNGTGSHIDYDYTEENFYKAYDEAVRLFRGEQL